MLRRKKKAPFMEALARFSCKLRKKGKTKKQAEMNTEPPINSSVHQRSSPLEISELLESILLHIDEKTLLVSAQRVNKRWRDTVTSSPRLQKKLFLQPDESDATARDPRHNPLLAAAFPFCFDDLTANPHGTAQRVLWAKSDILAAQPPAIVSEVLTPMPQEKPRKWVPVPRRAGPALEMQDLMLCILSKFRLGLRYSGGWDGQGIPDMDHERLVIGVDHANGFEVDEDLEGPNVSGFKVIGRLHEPSYARRRRAFEEAYDRSNGGSSKKS